MPDGCIDPASLDGDALTRWYLRSPADIDQERQAAANRRYEDFFYGPAYTTPAPEDDAGSTGGGDLTPPTAQTSAYDDVAPPDYDIAGTQPAQNAPTPPPLALAPDLTPQPAHPIDEPFLPPLTLDPVSTTASSPGIRTSASSPSTWPHGAQAKIPSYHANTPAMAGPIPATRQVISYGALHAPAPTDTELADLRRQQATFGDVTRKIDLQNAPFAAPVLAASALPFVPEVAAQWLFGEGAPQAGQAITNFIERDRYLRVGETTRPRQAAEHMLGSKIDWRPSPAGTTNRMWFGLTADR